MGRQVGRGVRMDSWIECRGRSEVAAECRPRRAGWNLIEVQEQAWLHLQGDVEGVAAFAA